MTVNHSNWLFLRLFAQLVPFLVQADAVKAFPGRDIQRFALFTSAEADVGWHFGFDVSHLSSFGRIDVDAWTILGADSHIKVSFLITNEAVGAVVAAVVDENLAECG